MEHFNAFLLVSDISRIALTAAFWGFVIKFWDFRNGRVLQRLAEFIMVLALHSTWLTVVHFDRRMDLLPWDLNAVNLSWTWVGSSAVIFTLIRLGQALLRKPIS